MRCISLPQRAAARTFAGGVLLALLGACASLPPMPPLAPTFAFTDTAGTTLGRAMAAQVDARPGLSGIVPLNEGRHAFAARAGLAAAAQRSIDVQYYIWRPDTSGALLAHALWAAAGRGVRVRMLLDDANTGGLDTVLAALDAHPDIEVRLFNPFAGRVSRLAGYATDFARLNRRMHNKLFVVDNQAVIVGGRNVGDEYFGAADAIDFADLDVLAAGAVVAQASASFDAYWNSPSAYPAAALFPAALPPAAGAAPPWTALAGDARAAAYAEAVRAVGPIPALLAGGGMREWTAARLLTDDPSKVLHPDDRTDLQMLPRLMQDMGSAQQELLMVSPYFVPTRRGTDALVAIAARGVRISVLTNSLASTDVTPAYSGYARYRKDLLRAGVRVYELKPSAVPHERDESRKLGGSSGASLHAKTYSVDGRRIFVGSFNFDPRSARLNTESGVVPESPALAGQLADFFARDVPQRAYEVRLDDSGNGLVWIERTGGSEVRHSRAPETGALRRAWSAVLGWLPIEWLL